MTTTRHDKVKAALERIATGAGSRDGLIDIAREALALLDAEEESADADAAVPCLNESDIDEFLHLDDGAKLEAYEAALRDAEKAEQLRRERDAAKAREKELEGIVLTGLDQFSRASKERDELQSRVKDLEAIAADKPQNALNLTGFWRDVAEKQTMKLKAAEKQLDEAAGLLREVAAEREAFISAMDIEDRASESGSWQSTSQEDKVRRAVLLFGRVADFLATIDAAKRDGGGS